MAFIERNEQQRWERALINERLSKAKEIYEKLLEAPWAELSVADRTRMEVLGWFTLESDDAPEIDYEPEEAA